MQVLVVDMNVGFTQKGNLYSPRVGALVKPMADFLSHLSESDRVVFLTDCHQPDDDEFKRFPSHCVKESGEEIVRLELISACRFGFEMFTKDEHDVFIYTNDNDIFDAGDNSWVVIGCVTDICIEATVAGLVMRGQNVYVVRNLIDTFDTPEHNADEINKFWFEQRFPNVWGARVVEDWKELV